MFFFTYTPDLRALIHACRFDNCCQPAAAAALELGNRAMSEHVHMVDAMVAAAMLRAQVEEDGRSLSAQLLDAVGRGADRHLLSEMQQPDALPAEQFAGRSVLVLFACVQLAEWDRAGFLTTPNDALSRRIPPLAVDASQSRCRPGLGIRRSSAAATSRRAALRQANP